MLNALTTTPTANPALLGPQLMAAFAAFCGNPSPVSLSTLTDAAKPFVPVVPAPWRAVTDGDAFALDFEEIRVETSKMLRSTALEEIGRALGYALAETIIGEALLLTGVEQLPEVAGGHIVEGGGKSILTFAFDSTSARRSQPDYNIAFEVAVERIAHGSPVRVSNRQGLGTKGTKLVQGIGEGRCTVQFFVR